MSVAGGASTVRQAIAAASGRDSTLDIAPVVLGGGERIRRQHWADAGDPRGRALPARLRTSATGWDEPGTWATCRGERVQYRRPVTPTTASRLRILPVEVMGERVDELHRCGGTWARHLLAVGPRRRALVLGERGAGVADDDRLTSSPWTSSGTPITAASETSGWVIGTSLDLARIHVVAAADDHGVFRTGRRCSTSRPRRACRGPRSGTNRRGIAAVVASGRLVVALQHVEPLIGPRRSRRRPRPRSSRG